MTTPFLLSNQKVIVLRQISPRKRWFKCRCTHLVPDQWLADKGLSIGNDLDQKDSPHQLGTRTPDSMWPVYLLRDIKEMDIFRKKPIWLNPSGTVAYKAEVDLNEISLGMNVAFPSKPAQITHTLLQTKQVGGSFALTPTDCPANLDQKLQAKLDSNGLLCDTSGEFYLSGYTGYHQLKNESILRSDGTQFTDITDSVKKLRP